MDLKTWFAKMLGNYGDDALRIANKSDDILPMVDDIVDATDVPYHNPNSVINRPFENRPYKRSKMFGGKYDEDLLDLTAGRNIEPMADGDDYKVKSLGNVLNRKPYDIAHLEDHKYLDGSTYTNMGSYGLNYKDWLPVQTYSDDPFDDIGGTYTFQDVPFRTPPIYSGTPNPVAFKENMLLNQQYSQLLKENPDYIRPKLPETFKELVADRRKWHSPKYELPF